MNSASSCEIGRVSLARFVWFVVAQNVAAIAASTLCSVNGLTKTLDSWRAHSMLRFMLYI